MTTHPTPTLDLSPLTNSEIAVRTRTARYIVAHNVLDGYHDNEWLRPRLDKSVEKLRVLEAASEQRLFGVSR
ncbi:MAG: hypothetical protein J7518_12440 [Nocardioidaceae bacterium]|nr:hypothetical protein [Nocardioidaceae bacterium]